jgi:hypothetical protein
MRVTSAIEKYVVSHCCCSSTVCQSMGDRPTQKSHMGQVTAQAVHHVPPNNRQKTAYNTIKTPTTNGAWQPVDENGCLQGGAIPWSFAQGECTTKEAVLSVTEHKFTCLCTTACLQTKHSASCSTKGLACQLFSLPNVRPRVTITKP